MSKRAIRFSRLFVVTKRRTDSREGLRRTGRSAFRVTCVRVTPLSAARRSTAATCRRRRVVAKQTSFDASPTVPRNVGNQYHTMRWDATVHNSRRKSSTNRSTSTTTSSDFPYSTSSCRDKQRFLIAYSTNSVVPYDKRSDVSYVRHVKHDTTNYN